jgi:hypothetical protein
MQRTNYNDARRMLVELLRDPDDGPVAGLDVMSDNDKRFLVSTCAVTVLMHQICFIAHYDEEEAKRGVVAMQIDKRISDICAGRAP